MTQRKCALTIGITGRDGSYSSNLLLEKGYEVDKIIRWTSTFNTDRVDHICVDSHNLAVRLFLHYKGFTDGNAR